MMVQLKSDREIMKLRRSAELVGKTLAQVASLIEPGVTTIELDRVAESFIRDHGAEPAFKGYRVGGLVFPATLCTSVNDEVVHGIPGDRTLNSGDIVSVDCGVLLDGYYGDSAYTFAVGEVDPELLRLCRVTYEALELGIEAAVAGNRIGDIGEVIQTHCEEHGFGVVKALVGHGIGQKLHEEPQVPNYGRRGTGRKLKSGLTICVEPMINLGPAAVDTDEDGWTVRTADRQPSAHYEHTIAIRKGKAEVLTSFHDIEQALETPPYRYEMALHG